VVLYSVKLRRWKIGDFGTCSEATSKRLNTTRDSRGTNCYRAPEILPDAAASDRPAFNHKADIWALGCIAFEILHGHKLFSSDWALMEATLMNKLPEISVDEQLPV